MLCTVAAAAAEACRGVRCCTVSAATFALRAEAGNTAPRSLVGWARWIAAALQQRLSGVGWSANGEGERAFPSGITVSFSLFGR